MKVIAGNVTAKFIDLTDSERKTLDQAFAVVDQKLFFIPQTKRLIMSGRMDGKKRFFDRRNDTIPTGLLPKVLTLFPYLDIERQITPEQWAKFNQSNINSQTVEVYDITFRQDQREAIISACQNMRGILECATNYGKTPVGAGIIKAINVPTLWVIHRAALLDETSQRVADYLGIPVGKMGGGHKSTGSLVTVGIDKTIINQGPKYLEQFECVIFDEAQHAYCKTQQDIAFGCINAPWRIAMSGSFPNDKMKLFQAMSAADATLLYKVTNSELIDAGISAKPKIFIRPLRYPPTVFGQSLYAFDWDAAYDYCIFNNEFYHLQVIADTEKWIDQDKTVLIFAERLNMANSICQKLQAKGLKHSLVTGDTPDFARREALRRFGKKEIPIIVTTVILDEGIDVPTLGAVVLASGGKSAVRLLQRIGRSIRKKKDGSNEAIIQDFEHVGSKYTERHYKQRHAIYKKQNFEITKEPEVIIA